MEINNIKPESGISELQEQNLLREAFLANLMKDPVFADTIAKVRRDKTPRTGTKRKRADSSFRFSGAVPRERRSSARLQNKSPEYSIGDLQETRTGEDSYDDLEKVVYRVKTPRKPSSQSPVSKIIAAEEVTEDMIAKIQTSGNKVYGAEGTSCHQCRQRTVDTKTICRSGYCVGVRGQFCGICVINRYGEDPVAALKDSNWTCYVCRGCCNCSLCRSKAGKRPTGILTPLARSNGYKSVFDFLHSLKGHGDYVQPHGDPENLLGFSQDRAVLGGGRTVLLESCRNCNNLRVKI